MPEMARSRNCSTMLGPMMVNPKHCHRMDAEGSVRRRGRVLMTVFGSGPRREVRVPGIWVLDPW